MIFYSIDRRDTSLLSMVDFSGLVKRLDSHYYRRLDAWSRVPTAVIGNVGQSKTEFLADVLGDSVLVNEDVVGLVLHEGAGNIPDALVVHAVGAP